MKTRLTALLICMLFLISTMVWHVTAADTAEYLALGDSISAAYGLETEEDGFVHLVAEKSGYILADKSVSGNTAIGILEELQTGELDTLITDVKLITITCGGNDLMHVLYTAIAQSFNATNGTSYTGEDIIEAFSGTNPDLNPLSLLFTALTVLDTFTETEEFQSALTGYENNMFGENGVLSYIREKNSEAEIIIATQYNPYQSFENSPLAKMSTQINAGAILLNEVIQNNASAWNYKIADVHASFLAFEENLCNADPDTMEFDFHPNAAGHKVIADTFISVSSFGIASCPICGTMYENGICPECEGSTNEESTTSETMSESETTTESEATSESETTTESEATSESKNTSADETTSISETESTSASGNSEETTNQDKPDTNKPPVNLTLILTVIFLIILVVFIIIFQKIRKNKAK